MRRKATWSGRRMLVAALAATMATALAIPTGAPATAVDATAKRTTSTASSLVTLSHVDLARGARRIGVAAETMLVQSTLQGTVNATLGSAAPYARIEPFTGDAYYVSAGELAQFFTALLGPRPTVGVSYSGETDSGMSRSRSITLTDSVTPPVFDVQTRQLRFSAAGSQMQPVRAANAIVTFVATDATRPVAAARPLAVTGKSLQGRVGAADANASYTYDGTTTYAKAFLNISAVSADIGTTGQTATVSGTIKCTSVNLGDN